MKKYIKADGIKTDIFEKATKQAAINDTYMCLRKLSSALDHLPKEVNDELDPKQLFHEEVLDKMDIISRYYKG